MPDEICPKCGAPLVFQITRSGKKLKKCSTGGWDREKKVATGCDYVEWPKTSQEELDKKCPDCGEKLLLVTTTTGKKLEKCSTSKWDPKTKTASGCTYIKWLNDNDSTFEVK